MDIATQEQPPRAAVGRDRHISTAHGALLGPLGRAVVEAGGDTVSAHPGVGVVRGRAGAWVPVVHEAHPAASRSGPMRYLRLVGLCIAAMLALLAIIESASHRSPMASTSHRTLVRSHRSPSVASSGTQSNARGAHESPAARSGEAFMSETASASATTRPVRHTAAVADRQAQIPRAPGFRPRQHMPTPGAPHAPRRPTNTPSPASIELAPVH